MAAPILPDSPRLAGIVTTAELLGLGVSAARIRTLVRRGALLPLARGVYARAALADAGGDRGLAVAAGGDRGLAVAAGGNSGLAVAGGGDRGLAVAAALAIRPETAASHHDAALIHGLALLDRPSGPVALTRSPDAPGSRSGRPGVRIHTASLPALQVTTRAGIRVTSVARTVVDLARTTSFKSGVVVADSALHAKRTTKAELRAVIQTCSRWPGIERARSVVFFSDGLAESAFESISRITFRDGGLPAPELQVLVGADGIVIGRVDFLWREHATIAEADGLAKYSDPMRARMQLERDALLRQAGFEVVHFTWRDLVINPAQVLRSVRAAFQRGAALRYHRVDGE